MTPLESPTRYHPFAVVLHWVMGLSFLAMLAMGLAFDNVPMDKALRFQMYQWHKSLGVLLLLAFVLRLSVRFIFKKPSLPDSMKPIEKKAAHFGHFALYVLMFALPFSGWIMVSTSVTGLPTIVFNWFEFPDFPGIAGVKGIRGIAGEAHEIMAFVLLGFIILHIGAVVKHAVFEKINLLPRMGFGSRSTKEGL